LATAPPQLSVKDAPAGLLKQRIADALDRVRRRTLALVEPLSERALNAVHDPLMSPIVWDLGHIANFEELWLVRRVGGRKPLREELGGVYDPFTAPRSRRGELPYLRSEDCLAYMDAVRARTLECLDAVDLSSAGERLLAGGFVYEMVARHERQHSETILQTLQIMESESYGPARAPTPRGSGQPDSMVLVEGGSFPLGGSEGWFAYDNERPQHEVTLDPYFLDVAPVTNGAFLEFADSGGYERQELWSEDGWRWRLQEQAAFPRYWERAGGEVVVRSFASRSVLAPTRPVCHVSWYEADAFARWRGKRLPTEAEWERAASWDPGTGTKRSNPWGDDPAFSGRANLDQLAFGTAEVGAYPAGASACGAQQMAGDVWEWTASGFERYPGFEPFPYREYSEEFFGGPYRVLRGGSWATQPGAVTTAFRNWDHPERRQIFAGFRCARDVSKGAV
jgi:iron(II)-dependent oxidoreductase